MNFRKLTSYMLCLCICGIPVWPVGKNSVIKSDKTQISLLSYPGSRVHARWWLGRSKRSLPDDHVILIMVLGQ